jgi:DNA modification methylase
MSETLWPADHVERWAVSRLLPHARNARTHSPEQVAQIAASIREWGWTVPVLVDEDGRLIAGHGRVMAAQQIGLTEVPAMVARGWSDQKKRAYMLADNKLALNAGWDEDLLRLELGELQGFGLDLSLTGFGDDELAALLLPNEGQTDPDEIPEPEAVAVSRPGEVWLLGRHRLACGDSTDPGTVAAVLAGAKPHLMVTDPPYGVSYDANWRNEPEKLNAKSKTAFGGLGIPRNAAKGLVLNDDRMDWTEAWSLFPGEVAYVWHGERQSPEIVQQFRVAGFEPRNLIVWAKDGLIISRGHYHPQHETCWYLVRKGGTGHWSGDRKQSTLWEIPKNRKNETGHSTQKPVECMRRPIENNSQAGDAVYEPFSGSGTTIIAAELTGRACRAIELSPTYVDVAVRRWQAFAAQDATLEGDGRTFAAVAEERLTREAA